jgi:hypothetical protein
VKFSSANNLSEILSLAPTLLIGFIRCLVRVTESVHCLCQKG